MHITPLRKRIAQTVKASLADKPSSSDDVIQATIEETYNTIHGMVVEQRFQAGEDLPWRACCDELADRLIYRFKKEEE